MNRQHPQQPSKRTLFFIVLVSLGAIIGINQLPSASSQSKANRSTFDEKTMAETAKKKRAQPNFFEDPDGAAAYVNKLAASYKGDWNSLSEDDKSFLNGMTAGHGHEMLMGRAKALKAKQKKAAGNRPVPGKEGGPLTESPLSEKREKTPE